MPEIRMLRLDDFPKEEIRRLVDLCNYMTDDANAKYGTSKAWLDAVADEADVIMAIWRNPSVKRGWEAGFLKGANADPAILKDRPVGEQNFKSIHIRLADLGTAIDVGLRYGDLVDTKRPAVKAN